MVVHSGLFGFGQAVLPTKERRNNSISRRTSQFKWRLRSCFGMNVRDLIVSEPCTTRGLSRLDCRDFPHGELTQRYGQRWLPERIPSSVIVANLAVIRVMLSRFHGLRHQISEIGCDGAGFRCGELCIGLVWTDSFGWELTPLSYNDWFPTMYCRQTTAAILVLARLSATLVRSNSNPALSFGCQESSKAEAFYFCRRKIHSVVDVLLIA